MKVSKITSINIHHQYRVARPLRKTGGVFNPLSEMLWKIRKQHEREIKTQQPVYQSPKTVDLQV